MFLELKLRKVGNSVGVVLPKDVLAHLKVQEGDMVCVTDAADGSVRLAPSSVEFTRQMVAAKSIIHRYRRTFRELAE